MGKLDTLAAEMKAYLAHKESGWQQIALKGGLIVILERRDLEQWRLALGREKVPPSDIELEVCREAFGAPEEAEPVRLRVKAKHSSNKTGRAVPYEVVELRWREAAPQVAA